MDASACIILALKIILRNFLLMASQVLEDDVSIQNDFVLIRGIVRQHHIVPDDRTGMGRISSKAFVASSKNSGLSIYIEKLMLKDNIEAKEYIKNLKQYDGTIYLYAGQVRQINNDMIIQHTPTHDKPYHGEIFYVVNGNARKFAKKIKRQLLKMIKWHIAIPGVKC